MTVIKDPYVFKDGRIGTLAKSDKFYKTIVESRPVPVTDENGTHLELQKVTRDVYYKIRKVGTDEVYDEAVDVIKYDYEEVTEAEMEAEYGSNK